MVDRTSIEGVIEGALIETVFQPIVDLVSGSVIAHEALSRGPRGSGLEKPSGLFDAARAHGLVAELDRLCIDTALRSARAAGLRRLFVNVEPETFDGPPPMTPDGVQVFAEVTERAVTARPAELLRALKLARAAGWGVAVDDLGADWRSLAFLPALRPDVIKLDRAILVGGHTRENARLLRAARAHVDRHGATLLAEGIEDLGHQQRAIGFGATLGQGFFLGRPGPQPADEDCEEMLEGVGHTPLDDELTPFEMLKRDGVPTAIGAKRDLLPLASDIELSSTEHREPSIVMGTFQHVRHFTAERRAHYTGLAQGAAFVAVFGIGISDQQAPGIVTSDLSEGEPLAHEWVVVSVGPHQAAGLIARDLGDDGPDHDRRFEYALLAGRELVERAARVLLLRISGVRPTTA